MLLTEGHSSLLGHLFHGPVTVTGATPQKQPGTCLGKGYLKPTFNLSVKEVVRFLILNNLNLKVIVSFINSLDKY